uniref:Uncharacterized protein n=1 Tax=Ditylenchus dipsaci TaxID=166011 RepID=A0A915EQ89_9BILA
MAFVSLLSGYIVAIQLHENQAEILWELKLNDVALKLLHCENRLYAMLANGTLAVLENAFEKMPTGLDLYHIPVSAAPITDALLDDEHLYLAVACKIVILNRSTLSTLGSIYVASSAAGSHVPMFEKIRAFSSSPHGIWLITAHSALIQLWKNSQCQMLFDVTYDHSHRRPSFDEDDQFDQVEVYCIMFHDREVWIGTVDGYLMLYKIMDQTAEGTHTGDDRGKLRHTNSQEASFSLHRYPPGKRLSPIHTDSVPNHRQQMYYIPTAIETQVEESASVNEYPESERQTRKISVVIDSSSRKYSVNVQPVRQVSADSANENSRVASSSTRSSSNENERTKPLASPRAKQNSIDSAVSVFSSSDGVTSKGSHQSSSKIHSEAMIANQNLSPRRGIISRRALENGRIGSSVASPMFSMGGSMEYDDYFEIYSENEQEQKMQDSGLAEDSLVSKYQNSVGKLIQIPVRKLSSSLFGKSNQLTVEDGTITSGDVSPIEQTAATTAQTLDLNANTKQDLQVDISSPSETSGEFNGSVSSTSSNVPQTIPEEVEIILSSSVDRPARRMSIVETTLHPTSSEENGPDAEIRNNLKLRRKDLNFDETLLVAVKETEMTPDETAVMSWSRRNSKAAVDNVVDVVETEIKSSLSMVLQMKLKISDKPVKCITATRFNGEDVVVTGAGNYGDEEAILRWRREKNSGLWINDPIVDPIVRGKKRTLLNPNASFRKNKL